MKLSHKVFANTLIQSVSKIFSASFTILTTIILTRYLGRENFGEYIYVITLLILFGGVADWGTLIIGVRELSKNTAKQGKILANILTLRLLLSVFASVMLIAYSLIAPGFSGLLRQSVAIASVYLVIIALRSSFDALFQSRLSMGKVAVVNVVSSATIFLFSAFCVQKGLGLVSLVSAYSIGALLGLAISFLLATRIVKVRLEFDPGIIRALLSESFVMGLILLMFTLDNKIDTIMLGIIKGNDAVGIYGLSYRIYDGIILGAAFIMNALFPIISNISPTGEAEKIKFVFQKTFSVLFLVGLMVLLGTWLFSPLMVLILSAGKFVEFAEAVPVLRILSFALFFAYMNHLLGYTIVALGKQKKYIITPLFGLIFNISANLVFIPVYSYFGAAWVTVFTEAISFVISAILIKKLYGLTFSLRKVPQSIIGLLS